MTEELEDFVEEYHESSAKISRQISALLQSSDSSATKTKEILARLFEETETTISNLEFELRSHPEEVKRRYRKKCEEFRTDMAQLRKDYERAVNQAKRMDLMGDSSSRREIGKEEQTLIKIGGVERKNTERLLAARSQLAGIEDQGVDALGELRRQRNVIERMGTNLQDGNSLMGKLSRTLRRMNRRQLYFSMGLCVLIFILLGVAVVWIYLKVRSRR